MIVFACHAYCEHVYIDDITINKHLQSPQYWLNKIEDQDTLLMTPDDIEAFNLNLLEFDDYVEDPLEYPDILDGVSLKAIVDSVSSKPVERHYYADKKKLTDKDYQRYRNNMNLRSIRGKNRIQFGIVVHRAALRMFPTKDRVFKDDMDPDLDRFQESALFPGESVAVLMTSKDQQWYFVRNYQLPGWIHKSAIALAKRKEVKSFQRIDPFIIITGDKVFTNQKPLTKHISNSQLDMGIRLPLVDIQKGINQSSYVVLFPVRNVDGYLNFTKVFLPIHTDLNVGYLPFTSANIIKQALKFLGERYGWGHDFNSRDCSGFIDEVYKSFGILMPRNSLQQSVGTYGANYRFDDTNSINDKSIFIRQMEVGDLIYIPGHVMMFIGNDNDKPYVIHDTKGAGYLTPDGHFHKQSFNKVVITPFLPLYSSPNITYLDQVYDIKRIRAIDTFY